MPASMSFILNLLLPVTPCAPKSSHSIMMLTSSRRENKNPRVEANEPHLSDVSAEELGTDSPGGADNEVKESRLARNQLRDQLQEQVFLPKSILLLSFRSWVSNWSLVLPRGGSLLSGGNESGNCIHFQHGEQGAHCRSSRI